MTIVDKVDGRCQWKHCRKPTLKRSAFCLGHDEETFARTIARHEQERGPNGQNDYTLVCHNCSHRREFRLTNRQVELVRASGKMGCESCRSRFVTLEPWDVGQIGTASAQKSTKAWRTVPTYPGRAA